MTTLLVVQPTRRAPLGRLGDWLAAAGAELRLVHPRDGALPADLTGIDGVVCTGGGMGALDDDRWPWLADVRMLLAGAVAADVPVLSMCLGAQLLATATGGGIRRAERPEIGPHLVAKRDAAVGDPLFGPVPMTPAVVQFHRDEIVLPPAATLLASSPATDVQAYRIGRATYGIQFHIETTPETVLEWAEKDPEAAALARPGHLAPDHLEELHAELVEVWEPFAQRFVALVSGDLTAADAPVGPGNRATLPLHRSV